MIVWLASYPKSGNTLVRSMLAAYFFSKEGVYDFDLIKNIRQFPNIRLFENIGIDIKNEKEVIKNYIKVQETFNKKNSIQFLKTHSYLFNIDNHGFTDLNNSLGVIYIVRDPRSVVKSYANHNQMSLDRASDRMLEFGATLGGIKNSKNDADRIFTYMNSWSSNYQSWKVFKKFDRYLLIKYEDMIKDKKNVFLSILEFIHKLSKSKFVLDENKLKNLLETTSFEYMKNLEKKKGFEESVKIKDSKKITFFKYGPKINKPESLPAEIKKKLEISLKKEMEELGYL